MADTYVFISYSREDRIFVERLITALRRAGVRTWTDLENILPGQEWAQEIEKGLLQSSALIYVASRSSIQSNWMQAELGAFLRQNRRIIPIVLDDAGGASLPPLIRELQWVDFRGAFEPAFASLLRGIGNLRDSSPIPPAEAKSKGYVFISYADEDSSFVTELKQFMTQKGYGYWDFRESKRNYQLDYSLELEGVIKGAKGTLSVISPFWKQSATALKEMHFSWGRRNPGFSPKGEGFGTNPRDRRVNFY
jgi:hypothetical protein